VFYAHISSKWSILQCPFGVAPSSLIVLPSSRVNALTLPAATIMDFTPMSNIMPFGMCNILTNPLVAATSVAKGVLTSQPCIPNIVSPWTTGSPTVLIGKKLALIQTSMCNCLWGSVFSITNQGQATVMVAG